MSDIKRKKTEWQSGMAKNITLINAIMNRYLLLMLCCMYISIGCNAQQKKTAHKTNKEPTAEERYERAMDYIEGIEGIEKSKGLTLLSDLVNINYIPAIRSLGKIKIRGLHDTPINEKDGYDLLKRGAELGDAECQWLFGWDIVMENFISQESKQQGVLWLEKAVEQNYPPAIQALGSLYYEGLVLNRNRTKAIELFNRGARLGDKACQYFLGQAYHFGWDGLSPDGKKAVFWYSKAANQNYVDAIYNLAVLYNEGELVKRDIYKANDLYKKAVDLKSSAAANNLSYNYSVGDGVNADKKMAFYYCKIAAELGDARGQLNLGVMLATGEGCLKDEEAARYWWRQVLKNKDATEDERAGAQKNIELLDE